jgi:hypothetical protein
MASAIWCLGKRWASVFLSCLGYDVVYLAACGVSLIRLRKAFLVLRRVELAPLGQIGRQGQQPSPVEGKLSGLDVDNRNRFGLYGIQRVG